MKYRVGHGYDVHRLEAGRRLILGGVEIEYERGLAGHSDADVLTHAVIDALLGAAGLGDIGEHFSDGDEQYKDISSMILLERTVKLVERDYNIVNIDCTVVAEQPKLAQYKQAMRDKLCKVLHIYRDEVNIKAKTEEGLGFTGSGEAIAAYAVCMIEKRGGKFAWL
jgi:2-C-methyl-D-erythritol 2,4-cyclodiphosphate synthase